MKNMAAFILSFSLSVPITEKSPPNHHFPLKEQYYLSGEFCPYGSFIVSSNQRISMAGLRALEGN